MGLPAEKRRFTVEEYLRLEQDSPSRHEFDDGEILATAGGSYEHSLIITNVSAALHGALDGKPCRVLDSNLRVGVPPARKFVYPDVHVICGPPQFDPRDRTRQTVTNPRVVVEVLSPTTEAYDRGTKFDRYRELPSFEEYVLVAQDSASVQTFFRQPDGTWLFTPFAGIDAVVEIRCLGVDLRLAEVYAGVEFPEQPITDPLTKENGPIL
jgi:Uma2 family endonuclease